jgi:hypothetical protein
MRPIRETFVIGGLFSPQANLLWSAPGSGRDASESINLFDRIGNKSAAMAVYPRPAPVATGLTLSSPRRPGG